MGGVFECAAQTGRDLGAELTALADALGGVNVRVERVGSAKLVW